MRAPAGDEQMRFAHSYYTAMNDCNVRITSTTSQSDEGDDYLQWATIRRRLHSNTFAEDEVDHSTVIEPGTNLSKLLRNDSVDK